MAKRARTLLLILGCARALGAQSPATARDSTFVLTARAPDRWPGPYIGNGHFGGIISATGIGAEPVLVAGLYEEADGDVPRITSVPAWNVVDLYDGVQWLSAQPTSASVLQQYAQTLDMRAGTVRTTFDWIDGDRRTSVLVDQLISRADPHLAAVRVELVPSVAGRMRVAFPLSAWPPPRRLALAQVVKYDPTWTPRDTWYPGHVAIQSRRARFGPSGGEVSLAGTPEGRTTVAAEVAAVAWPRDLDNAVADTSVVGDSAVVAVSFDAVPGRHYTFTKFVGLATSLEKGEPAARAGSVARAARAQGFDATRDASVAAWARRWRTDIVIAGNPELQRVVRAMMFQLLCSADSGTAIGIPPMGLSSGGYYGHVFWDADTWMFPSLALTHPDIARSLVDFRARTLDAARANAKANGYAGAMYPWEADERGRETTPRFASQNASSEIHVTGDVARAAWQYYLATGDQAWLAKRGYPVISETANFWVSRATHDSASDHYHIRNVVSVDEGLIGVNDDAYTNTVARRNLEAATAAARQLRRRPDPRWSRVAGRLHIAFDSARGTYRTYEGAPDSTLGSVTALLSYPLNMPMSPVVKRTNLLNAVHRMLAGERGALMGDALLAVVAAELGDRALVDTLLLPSYDGYLKGPFLLISETPRNDAVSFLTGAGGLLQQVIFGYTGLRIGERGLEPAFAPVLPSRVTRLMLRNVQVRGRRYDVIVDANGRRMVPVSG